MKNAKLVFSIIATSLGGIVLLQSCAASVAEDLDGIGASDSGAGMLMALLLIAAGIVGICTRKKSRWLCLACGIAYGLVGNIGIQNAEAFPDLEIWGGISFVFAAAYVIMFFIEFSAPKDTKKHE